MLLTLYCAIKALASRSQWVRTYEAFGGDVGRSKTTRSLVGVNDHPRRGVLSVR